MTPKSLPIVCLFVLAVAIVAQQPESHAPNQPSAEVQPAPPIEQNRGYRSRRDESLSRRERFDNSDIPPGYSSEDWSRAMAASGAYDRGYEDGFEQGWLAAERAAADQQRGGLYQAALDSGLKQFRAKRYGPAVRDFMFAAKNNQGDPVSRLHAAHAMAALGHYEDAFLLIRRALQLEPRLTYVPLDIRTFYADVAEFERRIEQVRADAEANPNEFRIWSVYGYFCLFSNRPELGASVLERAYKSAKNDDGTVKRLLDAARIMVPVSPEGRSAGKSSH